MTYTLFFKDFFFNVDHLNFIYKIYCFLMWTIFKVFIKFVTILLLLLMFCFFGPEASGILSFLIRDRARTPFIGRQSLNHWTTRKALKLHFKRFTLVAVAEEVGETSYHLIFSVCVWGCLKGSSALSWYEAASVLLQRAGPFLGEGPWWLSLSGKEGV